MRLKIGVDIGGTKVNAGILDENNQTLNKLVIPVSGMTDYKELIACVAAKIKTELANSYSNGYNDVAVCGIGVPGTVDKTGKIAVNAPNLGWDDAFVAEEFQKLTGVPTMLIQDSRAAAYAEYAIGNGAGKNIVVCVTLGTGIGTGIVVDGKVFSGALGGAGELGHIPVVENGRPCGCGMHGCLECYVAGKGLDQTARELYGDGFTAGELFKCADDGDTTANTKIKEAVKMLGAAMVSLVNLLSPNCLLFSGGLSMQRELFTEPLISYINQHRYQQGDMDIGYARLSSDAPMIGAALFAEANILGNNFADRLVADTPGKSIIKPPIAISASVMCADLLNLEQSIRQMERCGVQYLHFDIMDGHFVPNIMLPIGMLERVREKTDMFFDIHLMVERPENYISLLNLKKGDIVSVHYESTPHVQKALSMINEKGATAAIAINPSTPVETITEILPDIGVLLIMTVNPGFAGQRLFPNALDKIRRARLFLNETPYSDIKIQVDGNCSFENIPKMKEAGAEIFVAGTSSLFQKGITISEAVKRIIAAT